MRISTSLSSLLLALAVAGCGSDSTPTAPSEPAPVLVSESFSGTLTVNGLQAHVFTATRAGTASVQLTALSDPGATFALSLGTWNGAACQIVIANPAAVLNTAVTGTAQVAGQFCALLNDAGKLTAPVDYTVDVQQY
jgi:hypothetical protein